jgi:site-specific recombinase XerD
MARPKKDYTHVHVLIDPFIEQWRDPVSQVLSATGAGYWSDLALFVEWLETRTGVSYSTPADLARAITPTNAQAYIDADIEKKRAPATINRHLIALRAFSRWAIKQGHILSDPTADIQSVKVIASSAPQWLSRKQQEALRRAAKQDGDPRNLALIALMLHTGLRVEEVVELKLGDVKLDARRGYLNVQGKGFKARVIPLDSETRRILRTYLKSRPQVESDAFFIGQKLEPLGKLGIQYVIKVLSEKAGLQCSANTLRHTFAKNLIDSGVPIEQVSEMLGHRTLVSITRYLAPNQRESMDV